MCPQGNIRILIIRGSLNIYIRFLTGLEDRHLDTLVVPVTILFIFSIAQLLVNRSYELVETERAGIYRAMLRSTQHVLNNFLNNMLLFRLTADRTPGFPKEVIDLFDRVINDASAQIGSMGAIEKINVKSIHESVAPREKDGNPAGRTGSSAPGSGRT